MKSSRATLLARIVFPVLAIGWVFAGSGNGVTGGPAALAQNLGQRVVEGKVLDSSSAAASGATVFLKNLKNKAIRSFTSEGDGCFRFTQVNMADDYDLWAEKGSQKSATKTVSSWDTRTDYQCDLRLK